MDCDEQPIMCIFWFLVKTDGYSDILRYNDFFQPNCVTCGEQPPMVETNGGRQGQVAALHRLHNLAEKKTLYLRMSE